MTKAHDSDQADKTVMQHKALLEARGITKVFGSGAGEITVLSSVDLDLHPGELTLLMGPSGSGKTTLLSILGCIMNPTAGSLRIADRSTTGLSAEGLAEIRRNHIGFIFQSYNLFPTLSALENVLLALDVQTGTAHFRQDTETRQKAETALIDVGLAHRLDALPSKLSGGEKQRVAIARALAASPSVVLADEPTAALDGENGSAVMELMSRVAKDKSRAVLAVTHDHRILKYADRIIHIDDGRISGEERPGETSTVVAIKSKPPEPKGGGTSKPPTGKKRRGRRRNNGEPRRGPVVRPVVVDSATETDKV
ncbi:MAG: ABC transporter ATP-binding protein [Pseudomonadota bacterium]